jgi:hypothetical protein
MMKKTKKIKIIANKKTKLTKAKIIKTMNSNLKIKNKKKIAKNLKHV